MTDKKIWLTGAGGMLAQALAAELTRHDVVFVATDKSALDVTDLEAVSRFIKKEKPTHIVNAAAYTRVDDAEHDTLLATRINAHGPDNLGYAASFREIRVLHFSTDYVFSGQSSLPYREDDKRSPQNIYGASKAMGEYRLLEGPSGSRSLVVRTSWLFGPSSPNRPRPNFVRAMLRLMQSESEVKVVSDQWGRPTCTSDLAEASLALAGITTPDAIGPLTRLPIVHYANVGQTSWHGFATAIWHAARELGFPIKSAEPQAIRGSSFPRPARRPAHAVLSTELAEGLLGAGSPRHFLAPLREYLMALQSGEAVL